MVLRSMLAAVLTTAVAATLASATTAPANAGPLPYRIMDLGAGDGSEALAINDRGHVVGRPQPATVHHTAVLVARREIIDLLPPGELGRATGINDFDEVVGFRTTNRVSRAFVWRRGELTDLGVLPGGSISVARSINNDGVVVGNTALDAFLWENGEITIVPSLIGSTTSAFGINNNRQIVASSSATPAA
jgi:probable HAF family extracellular repeat protein